MNLRTLIKNFPILALLAMALPAFGFNPSSVPRHQKESPEQLEIEVTRIDEKKVKSGEIDCVAMEAQAKVTKVVASATGKKVGETIQIFWLIPQSDKAIGGGWPAKIKEGWYRAYLRVDGENPKRYMPAAYTGSFVAEKAEEAEAGEQGRISAVAGLPGRAAEQPEARRASATGLRVGSGCSGRGNRF